MEDTIGGDGYESLQCRTVLTMSWKIKLTGSTDYSLQKNIPETSMNDLRAHLKMLEHLSQYRLFFRLRNFMKSLMT